MPYVLIALHAAAWIVAHVFTQQRLRRAESHLEALGDQLVSHHQRLAAVEAQAQAQAKAQPEPKPDHKHKGK